MAWFKRWDGELIRDESPLRAIVPYLMRTRSESVVFHEEIVALDKALPFLARWNEAHPEQKATVFHLLMAGVARTLWARPRLNRFVAGTQLYQRKGVQVSFAAKKRFEDGAPIVMLKLEMPEQEAFQALLARCHGTIGTGRSDAKSRVDQELGLAMAMPAFVLSPVMKLLAWLDTVNLLPAAFSAADPLFASVALANLGSLGIDRTWHHLYEWGTISLFGTLGEVRKHVLVGPDDQPVVRDAVSVRWSFDERIADGFYCASSLEQCNAVIEDPEACLGSPD